MSNKLELVLRKAGRDLADAQIARFFKVPEEMQETPCDFFGYTAIGRAILIEAKYVHRKSLPICDSSNGLSAHQWNELLDANRAGALALICWGQGDIVKTISMDMAIALTKGRKSIAWNEIGDELIRHLSPTRTLELLDHWLPVGQQSA